ncbi:MAG: ABC transporter ATP-binding protein [Treponema sp.]|nr:ABC transporter ATP-binding protein [Treponema sp.]
MKLRIHSLSKNYTGPEGKTIHALVDCSMNIEDGSFTVIVGRSGCGKTTLLKLIAGLEEPGLGTVEFSAVPKMGFMFQDPRLLPWLTVEENLALAFPRSGSRAEKAAVRDKIRRVLAMTGLADRSGSLPQELSGGMAQRTALARCLCRNPDILLLDEPLSSLDAFTRLRLREELEKLWQQLGLTVILVTHEIEEAVFFGERIFLMSEGKLKNEVPIPLPRPRDYRGTEFQEYCQKIEKELCRCGAKNESKNME